MRIILGIYLGISTLLDIRRRQVSVVFTGICAAAGFFAQIMWGDIGFVSLAGGILLGGLILGIGRITKEAIGYGDGLAVGVAGICLGAAEVLELLLIGCTLAAIAGGLLLVLKKVKGTEQMPFIPFLFGGYVMLSVISF